MLNIKSFPVILLQWVCLISWCVRVRAWMVVCLGPKNECAWVVISYCKWTSDDVGPVVSPSLHHSLLLLPPLPAEAHDGDDRIPRLPAQTRAHRSRIRGESQASYFTLLCPVILTAHKHPHIIPTNSSIPFSLCLLNDFPSDITMHPGWFRWSKNTLCAGVNEPETHRWDCSNK